MTPINPLSLREGEVVNLLLQGKSNKLIALSLGISDRTVEFHLKNIYAKLQVSSRLELVLKLVNTKGNAFYDILGDSTVDKLGEKAENRDKLLSLTNWVTTITNNIFIFGRELQMKNLWNTMHVFIGVFTALFTGLIWVALLRRFGHASIDSILPWILPLGVILSMIGLSIGLIARHKSNSPGKVFFSTLFGTGLGSIMMLPLTGLIFYPLAKLAMSFGLINRTAIPNDVASTLVYVAMLVIWLVVGITIGIMVLSLKTKKQVQKLTQALVPDHH